MMGEIRNTGDRIAAGKLAKPGPNVNNFGDISFLTTICPSETNFLRLIINELRKTGISERHRAGNELRDS
jgi:hypothetical protein